MKYCPKCRRTYGEPDRLCPEHDIELEVRERESVRTCDLCGRVVEPAERACANCGAKVDLFNEPQADLEFYPKTLKNEGLKRGFEGSDPDCGWAGAEWFASGEDRKPAEESFQFEEEWESARKRKRVGSILTAGGFIAGLAVGLVMMREIYDGRPSNPSVQAESESSSPPALSPPGANPFMDKSFSTEALPKSALASPDESLPRVEPPAPDDQEPPAAKIGGGGAGERSLSTANRRAGKNGTEISLKTPGGARAPAAEGQRKKAAPESERRAEKWAIPPGVTIPSPAELRRRRAQHEAELAMQKIAIPAGVEIPSPAEIRRRRIEHEVEQAIQNRAIEGVTVSLIGNTVFLKGQVATERQKAAAEQAARSVSEAENIRSAITVRGTKG
ncbi:MAG TPA: BON domain-containing protein [Candidatus Acidoferrales bacterium]|nr:BON domain-containing protein [Candidatus Acidoferrales bacterium]